MSSRKLILFGILCSALVTGCLKTGQFPPEPHLEFLSFTNDPQDPVLRFKFTDGDGNIGLDARDTLPPFNPTNTPVNRYHWNLWIKYYEKINGQWYSYQSENPSGLLYLDPNATFSRIPRLDPKGQNKALEGEVVIDMNGWYPLTPADTIKYGVIIVDRDLNQSSEAQTPELYPNQ